MYRKYDNLRLSIDPVQLVTEVIRLTGDRGADPPIGAPGEGACSHADQAVHIPGLILNRLNIGGWTDPKRGGLFLPAPGSQ